MESMNIARCQFCDIKFGHRIKEALDSFDYEIYNSIQITFHLAHKWSKCVVSEFSEIMLHKWYSCKLQYIPRNMHTVVALLCFVVVIHWLIFPYPSGLLHWHCGNLTIAPMPAKQPWWIWINTSCEFIMNDCVTTTKQSITNPCAYFLGYTVYMIKRKRDNGLSISDKAEILIPPSCSNTSICKH